MIRKGGAEHFWLPFVVYCPTDRTAALHTTNHLPVSRPALLSRARYLPLSQHWAPEKVDEAAWTHELTAMLAINITRHARRQQGFCGGFKLPRLIPAPYMIRNLGYRIRWAGLNRMPRAPRSGFSVLRLPAPRKRHAGGGRRCTAISPIPDFGDRGKFGLPRSRLLRRS